MNNTFQYNNETWEVVYDEKLAPAKHCFLCEFSQYCEDYVDKNDWFACGVFHPNKYYVKKV